MTNLDFSTPDWLYVGQFVYVPHIDHDTGKLLYVKAEVYVATGDVGWVRNDRYGIDRLVNRWDMLVDKTK